MKSILYKTLLPAAMILSALPGLTGCMSSEAKPAEESSLQEQARQVSSKLEKPYPMNEQGEIIAEIPPLLLEAIKADLRKQAKLTAAADLEDLYDPATGKLRDGAKLAEIQNRADKLSNALSKGAAQ